MKREDDQYDDKAWFLEWRGSGIF